jgi:RNA polymerase sigma factor (sigma-70 family)
MGGMHWSGVHVLVHKAQQGDRQAMDCLVALARPFLLRQAQKLIGPSWPEKSISDLTQQTWIRAWTHIASFRGGNDDANTGALFRAWLQTIMTNVWRNDIRRPQPRVGLAPSGGTDSSTSQAGLANVPAADPTPSAYVRQDEQRAVLQQALDGLPEVARQIVQLRFFAQEKLSFAEIGERLGCDESTVRYHLDRILKDLANQLKGLQ